MLSTSTQRVLTDREWIECVPGFTFYLTGSRFFGNGTEKSDWDYFALDSLEITEALRERGFREVTENEQSYPLQFGITSIWKKEDIHIQLVKNPQAKAFVQDMMKPSVVSFKLNSSQTRILWRLVMELYKTTPWENDL